MHVISLLLLLLLATPALGAESRTIAVDVPAGAEEVADPLRKSGWVRWLLSQNKGLEVKVEPGAEGDTEILVRPLPVSEEVAGLLTGLPASLKGGILKLDGTAYRDHQLTFALRLPRTEKRTWLVTGYRLDRLADLAGMVLLKEAGARIWGRGDEPFDYLLRETAWLERSGVWKQAAGGIRVDRDAERNDFAGRDAYYDTMRTIPGRWVELRASKETAARPEIRELAGRLDAATAEMASRVPLDLERPIRLVIERDHAVQGRHLGDIGEAVLAPSGVVHVVYHARDEYAYRHRIAQALLDRAGFGPPSGERPLPWIEEGAALWLSGQWFGREWQEWLPRLAAARLLPRAEQLLAGEKQGDSSAPLWLPTAASLVAASPARPRARSSGRFRACRRCGRTWPGCMI